MPLNLLKNYNQLLDILALPDPQKRLSLKGVFNRDITNNPNFTFNRKRIQPTPIDGEETMETLFRHLTTVMTDKITRRREFEINRSCRLHWVKYHIERRKADVLIFSVQEPEGERTYIYDKEEKYVIVLEPLRNVNEYYLLTAYNLIGKDAKRDKIGKKYKRRLPELL